MLSLDQWKEVIREAASLGLKSLSISGGEPTLYPYLIELIQEIKKYGILVQINTNGTPINKELAENLLEAGLDSIFISIYSHRLEIHDAFRVQRNAWRRAVNAVRIFADLGPSYPKFRLKTQTIIWRENFRDFKQLIELHQSLGAHQSSISYLEGDFDRQYLLNEEEILEFKNHVAPQAIELSEKLHPSIRKKFEKAIRQIYEDRIGNPSDIAQGQYWRQGDCKIPQQFTIILANGDVHPCNIVEYTHEPIMGNLFEKSFTEIWKSKKWNDYRRNLHDKCHLCPMNIHTTLPFKPEKITFSRLSAYLAKSLTLIR